MVKHSSKCSLIVFSNTIVPHTGHGTRLPCGCATGGGGGWFTTGKRGRRGRRTSSDTDSSSLVSVSLRDSEPVPEASASSSRIRLARSSKPSSTVAGTCVTGVTPNSANSWSNSLSSGVMALIASCKLPPTWLARSIRSVQCR